MADFIDVQTYGFEELHNALQYLPDEIRTKCVNGALRAGGKEIVIAAKRNIRRRSGALADAITMRNDRKNPFCALLLGPMLKTDTSSKGKNMKPFYAHMIEWGTQSHDIKSKKGKPLLIPGSGHPVYEVHVSGITAQRPFTRAVDEKRTAFLWQFGAYIDRYIKKHFQKWASNIIRGSYA